VAEGGLLVAVAEACLAGGVGAAIEGPDSDGLRRLFGEAPGGCFVVSGSREALERLGERAPTTLLGTVGGDALEVTGAGGFVVTLDELREAHGALAAAFE
jgi:phosphoribosylformylglycinamidine synthase